ncbi:MAG TPA: molybdopterin molybdotransferase MoeA, partial [Bacteroidia bacterium]|nr:molybdopterin molybdotransferase MoeA [Bacteroidia bacterium]
MISVFEAKKLVLEYTELLKPESIHLYNATGRILAEDIFSDMDVPSFNQAAMDGYGFRYDDLKGNDSFSVIGEIPAGVFPMIKLSPGTAVRIFTGAVIPDGCDTVVIQEHVSVNGKHIFVNDPKIAKGMNIRTKGSQTKKGSLSLEAGSKITPGVAGFLSGLGFDKVRVFGSPKVCIITTGKELILPGQPLKYGKVYECNSYSMNAALCELNIKPHKLINVDDNAIEITNAIESNLSDCDVMIISGGISVGDFDLVHASLTNCGVQQVFHRVKQKPGKPIYFGKYGRKMVFGLPGNPSALLICYYQYILPALKKMMKHTEIRTEGNLPLSEPYSKKSGLTYFLKGKISDNEVIPLNAQDSNQMNSFAIS